MLKLNRLHHIAIICSDYQKSKTFYINTLGFRLLKEHWREERQSWKLDLALGSDYLIELFSFPAPPDRMTQPEAAGARHIAFEVDNLAEAVTQLEEKAVSVEPIRIDEYTGRRFAFFQDPDGLPLELYEADKS
ncbi:MAG: SMU1112c/YaeR family gloxylase I-like metalloprotein [Endozoicomonas sp.]|uniref:SMU1112c/YaeR family gloxylase I-like metalloprotein n=1 Tax=Endozoicomonas sp. TaxID=1892382 RepID=UPI003D9BF413